MEEDRLFDHTYKAKAEAVNMNKTYALIIIVFLTLTGCALNGSGLRIVDVAERSDPLNINEHLSLGAAYEGRGLFEAALKEYRSAIRINNADSRGHFGVANVYLKTRRFNLAEKGFLRAIDLNPDEGLYYNNLAWVYIETRRPIDALVMASSAMSLDMERREIYLDTMGVAETIIGNYPMAEQYLKEAAIIISPIDTAGQVHIYEHLLALYVRSKDRDKAAVVKGKLLNLRRGIPAIMDF